MVKISEKGLGSFHIYTYQLFNAYHIPFTILGDLHTLSYLCQFHEVSTVNYLHFSDEETEA